MSYPLSTVEAAQVLGLKAGTLAKAVWDRRIPAPTKGPGACYHWTLSDIERASEKLLGHGLSEPARRRMESFQVIHEQ